MSCLRQQPPLAKFMLFPPQLFAKMCTQNKEINLKKKNKQTKTIPRLWLFLQPVSQRPQRHHRHHARGAESDSKTPGSLFPNKDEALSSRIYQHIPTFSQVRALRRSETGLLGTASQRKAHTPPELASAFLLPKFLGNRNSSPLADFLYITTGRYDL